MAINSVTFSGRINFTKQVSGKVTTFNLSHKKGDSYNGITCKLLGEKSLEFHGHKVVDGLYAVVQGELVEESWEKDGKKNRAHAIIVRSMENIAYDAPSGSSAPTPPSADDEAIPF